MEVEVHTHQGKGVVVVVEVVVGSQEGEVEVEVEGVEHQHHHKMVVVVVVVVVAVEGQLVQYLKFQPWSVVHSLHGVKNAHLITTQPSPPSPPTTPTHNQGKKSMICICRCTKINNKTSVYRIWLEHW